MDTDLVLLCACSVVLCCDSGACFCGEVLCCVEFCSCEVGVAIVFAMLCCCCCVVLMQQRVSTLSHRILPVVQVAEGIVACVFKAA